MEHQDVPIPPADRDALVAALQARVLAAEAQADSAARAAAESRREALRLSQEVRVLRARLETSRARRRRGLR